MLTGTLPDASSLPNNRGLCPDSCVGFKNVLNIYGRGMSDLSCGKYFTWKNRKKAKVSNFAWNTVLTGDFGTTVGGKDIAKRIYF
jgi:hypothetical protein